MTGVFRVPMAMLVATAFSAASGASSAAPTPVPVKTILRDHNIDRAQLSFHWARSTRPRRVHQLSAQLTMRYADKDVLVIDLLHAPRRSRIARVYPVVGYATALPPELRGKGLGTVAYMAASLLSLADNGSQMRSDPHGMTSDAASRVWQRLTDRGIARQNRDGTYMFIPRALRQGALGEAAELLEGNVQRRELTEWELRDDTLAK